MTGFLGFPRKYGPPGIRNHVLVISGELSCNPWALQIAAQVGDCCAVTHKQGAANYGSDRDTFLRVMSGMMLHPNVAGALLVASGGEDYDSAELVREVAQKGRFAHLVSLRKQKTPRAVLSKGVEHARRLVRPAKEARRTRVGLDQIRVGLNCAGTDTSSLATSNAVCGAAVDRLVELGATAVLSELPEMIGAGQAFFDRCLTKKISRRLEAAVARHERRLLAGGEDLTKTELCPFNIQGGLTSLEQKSRISVTKAGTSPIKELVGYGQTPSTSGLVVMDGPALTDFVMTGLMAAGVHLMANCCGAGPANRLPVMVGADATAPILPVVKITGSTRHFRQTENRIDFDAGPLQRHPERLPDMSERLVKLIAAVASGKPTRTERLQNFFVNFPMRHYQA